jgi:hypothetical protein
MDKISRQFHFIWFSDKPEELTYLQFFSIVSTVHYNPTYKVNLFTDNCFVGELWDKLKHKVGVYPIERPNFKTKGTDYSKFVAYSDIARNLIIKEYGGVYCDLDVVWKKPIEELLQFLQTSNLSRPLYAVGAQGKNACEGVNMGVIIGEKDNLFTDEYLKTFSEYDQLVKQPSDHIKYYSTSIPLYLLKQNQSLGTILTFDLFHWPLYHVTKNWFLAGDSHPDLKNGPKFSPLGGGLWSNESFDNSLAHHCFFLDDRLKDGNISINGFDDQKKIDDLKIDPSNIRAGQYNYSLDMSVREFIETIQSPFTELCKPLLSYL